MAYVNVLEWRAEQVAEWLQGLDDSIYPYAHSFLNNNVTGRGLLNITVDDLYKLQVEKVGHQEIILEALEHLRNLHHNLDSENLQHVALRVACRARSLTNEIRLYGPDPHDKEQKVDTGTAGAVADVLDALWTLISWLDRPPFIKNAPLQDYKKRLLVIGSEMGMHVVRGTTWIKHMPILKIQEFCEELAQLADVLIRDVDDPLTLQPASLDIATAKRKPNDDTMDFGIGFEPLPLNGTHVIRDVRFQSPAHQCARIHPGDEVVQINYQTVVGWTLKKIMLLMDENPSELIVTLKKRPRHLSMFGQIYMKPFRIPARTSSGKKGLGTFNNLPSPRAELLVAPNIRIAKPALSREDTEKGDPLSSSSGPRLSGLAGLSIEDVAVTSDDDDDLINDDAFLACDDVMEATVSSLSPSKSPTQSVRSLLSRPRSTPMRRATISGSSPSLSRPYINISEIWSSHARNIHSMDHGAASAVSSSRGGGRSSSGSSSCGGGGDGGSNSNTSTLASNDSGHATMASPNPQHHHPSEVLRKTKSSAPGLHPRPVTMCGSSVDFSTQPNYPPPKITTTDFSSATELESGGTGRGLKLTPTRLTPPPSDLEYINMDTIESSAKRKSLNQSTVSSQQMSQKTPMPKPRTQLSSTSVVAASVSSGEKASPNRKKPIPQPRSGVVPSGTPATRGHANSPKQSSPHKGGGGTIKSLKQSLLPDKPSIQPVPTAEFQSFRRVSNPSSPAQPTNAHIHPQPPSELKVASQVNKKQPHSQGLELRGCVGANSPKLPEYINTTPPAVPARNSTSSMASPPSRTGSSRTDLLQQSKQPSSRRFSGAGLQPQQSNQDHQMVSSLVEPPLPPPPNTRRPLLGKIPRGSSVELASTSSIQSSSAGSSFEASSPQQGHQSASPPPPPPSRTSASSMEPQYHQHQGFSSASPYCVTDLMDQRVAGGSRHPATSPGRLPYPPPAPPQQHQQISLPPVFTPQTYNLQEMHQQRSSATGIRRQMATNSSSEAVTPPEEPDDNRQK